MFSELELSTPLSICVVLSEVTGEPTWKCECIYWIHFCEITKNLRLLLSERICSKYALLETILEAGSDWERELQAWLNKTTGRIPAFTKLLYAPKMYIYGPTSGSGFSWEPTTSELTGAAGNNQITLNSGYILSLIHCNKFQLFLRIKDKLLSRLSFTIGWMTLTL